MWEAFAQQKRVRAKRGGSAARPNIVHLSVARITKTSCTKRKDYNDNTRNTTPKGPKQHRNAQRTKTKNNTITQTRNAANPRPATPGQKARRWQPGAAAGFCAQVWHKGSRLARARSATDPEAGIAAGHRSLAHLSHVHNCVAQRFALARARSATDPEAETAAGHRSVAFLNHAQKSYSRPHQMCQVALSEPSGQKSFLTWVRSLLMRAMHDDPPPRWPATNPGSRNCNRAPQRGAHEPRAERLFSTPVRCRAHGNDTVVMRDMRRS